jgi:transcriptional regulator with GAF, ATPase, and Fis domain
MVRDSSRCDSLNEVLAEAATVLSSEIGADIVRISTPDSHHAFLKSRAMVMNHAYDTMVPANGELIVSLMPLHEQVLRDGQSMLSGSGDQNSSLVAFERQQAFAGDVKSSIMVPVTINEKVVAVISAASMSDTRRLHRDNGALVFAESVARCLASSVASGQPEKREAVPDLPERNITIRDRKIIAEISDSLERSWFRSEPSGNRITEKYRALIDQTPADTERSLVPET